MSARLAQVSLKRIIDAAARCRLSWSAVSHEDSPRGTCSSGLQGQSTAQQVWKSDILILSIRNLDISIIYRNFLSVSVLFWGVVYRFFFGQPHQALPSYWPLRKMSGSMWKNCWKPCLLQLAWRNVRGHCKLQWLGGDERDGSPSKRMFFFTIKNLSFTFEHSDFTAKSWDCNGKWGGMVGMA